MSKRNTFTSTLEAWAVISPVDTDTVSCADIEWLRSKIGEDIVDCSDERIDPMRGESLRDVLLTEQEVNLDPALDWECTRIVVRAIGPTAANDPQDTRITIEYDLEGKED